VGERAWQAVEHSTLPKFYFDLKTYQTAYREGRGPATLPVTLLSGMCASLDLLHAEGIKNVWKRHARHAEAVRNATEALGLSVHARQPSNALTAIALPESIDGLALMEQLRTRYGITVGGGLAHLRGRIIRISNLGHVEDLDILDVLSALEMSLSALGWPFTPGAGIAAAEQIL